MAERDHGFVLGAAARGRVACGLGALALALLASTAHANGRFPRAQRLIQDQVNPDVMALSGTYGLLVTRDAGASWHHVCEAATGVYAGEDSLLEIMADEHIVVRTDTGLSRSDASFCSYDAVLGSESEALQDITRDSGNPNGLLALTTTLGDDGVFATTLSASTDGGATFTPIREVPADILQLGLTLDVAATDPDVIYISGLDDVGRAKLAKSTNRGQSFVGLPIEGLDAASPPYIAAISALDPSRVFVRSDVYSRDQNDFEARETANDSLYFTPDGGQTWHQSLHKRGKLYGFALSPDEQWVLAGFGDPVLPAIFVEPDELGLYRVAVADLIASPDAPPWERIYDQGVTCLRWTERELFVCTAQDQSGFEVGRAPDANFSLADEAPLAGVLRLSEVRPVECSAETEGAACLVDTTTGWLATCGVLRAQCSLDGSGGSAGNPGGAGQGSTGAGGAPGSSTGGASSAPTGPGSASGMGGAASSEPAGAANGAAPGSGASPSQPGSASGSSGSCSVAHPRATSNGRTAAWCLLSLLLLAVRRRRMPPRDALIVALLPLGASGLGACSDGAASDASSSGAGDGANDDTAAAPPPIDCGDSAEDFVLGMSKTAADGAFTAAIVAADPAPPLVGPNAWTVLLSDASSAPITAGDVTLTGWMPQHGHGLNAVPTVHELDGGRYEIQPIILFMPQLWEFGVVLGRDEAREVVNFRFCVR